MAFTNYQPSDDNTIIGVSRLNNVIKEVFGFEDGINDDRVDSIHFSKDTIEKDGKKYCKVIIAIGKEEKPIQLKSGILKRLGYNVSQYGKPLEFYEYIVENTSCENGGKCIPCGNAEELSGFKLRNSGKLYSTPFNSPKTE